LDAWRLPDEDGGLIRLTTAALVALIPMNRMSLSETVVQP